MVLPDPDAAIIDAHESIEALETALEELRQYVDKKLPSLELLQRLEVLETQDKHADRWHATYNAALTGIEANPDEDIVRWGDEDVHEHCVVAADRAHGPLEAAVIILSKFKEADTPADAKPLEAEQP